VNVCMNCGQLTNRRHKRGDTFTCQQQQPIPTQTPVNVYSPHGLYACVVPSGSLTLGVVVALAPGTGDCRITPNRQWAKDGHRLRQKQERQPAQVRTTAYPNMKFNGGVRGGRTQTTHHQKQLKTRNPKPENTEPTTSGKGDNCA
jgi:hypothetical protein